MFFVFACKEDRNCGDAIPTYDSSMTYFYENPTVSNCEKYKQQLQELVNTCLVEFSPKQRGEILETLKAINDSTCRNYIKHID